jgi:hypothetical protein
MSNLEKAFNYQEARVYYTPSFDLLPEREKTILEPQLIRTACEGFQRPETPEFSQDVSSHIRGGDLYVVEQENEATGFAMLETFPTEGVVYIAGVVKKPESPSKIIEKIVRFHLREAGLKSLVVRTQNDRVLEILANICRRVIALDGLAKNEEVDLLGRMGLVRPDSILDEDYLIHRGYYGSPMIAQGERRRSKNPRVTNLTDRLDYQKGDAAYGIGYKQ